MYKGNPEIELSDWMQENKEELEEAYAKYGVILFRGFKVDGEAAFTDCTKHLSKELLEYNEPSTPRTRVSGKIYTSTEYPKDQFIPMHNEHSYSTNWPEKLWLYCDIAPQEGGQTPLADSHVIYNELSSELKNEFVEKGIMYVRNFSEGLDLPWQHVYQTESKEELEQILNEKGIDFEWKEGTNLCTRQRAQVITKHPETEETMWFNQTHLFHITNLPEEVREFLIEMRGIENVPRNVYFGDGSEIPSNYLEEIRRVYKENLLIFDWEESDVVLVDNVRYAHGRNPFDGPRKILVAMSN